MMAARKNAGVRWAAGLVVVVLASAIVLAGQQQQQPQVQIPMTEEQKLEVFVSEMLAAWQIGDLELMHKYYADDVMVVSAFYEPPIIGWTSYAQAYLRQRERLEGQVRLERSNSYLTVRGNVAWITYQWDFSALSQGATITAQGHTTLVMEKRAGKWLIVLNHTSAAGQPTQPTAPTQPPKP
jgi:ketosteroid isomerase-like protein